MTIRSLVETIPHAFAKLDPRHVWHSPVIFVVWVGSALTTALAIAHPRLVMASVTPLRAEATGTAGV